MQRTAVFLDKSPAVLFMKFYDFFSRTPEKELDFLSQSSKIEFTEQLKQKGLVAQLGERRVRNAEAEGSNPFGSMICDLHQKGSIAQLG